MEKLYFIADTKRGGDLGNYWHYMLGYFLPVVTFLRKNQDFISSKDLIFDSCNPLTDAILSEYLEEQEIPFSFEKMTNKGMDVPRADWKSISGKIKRQFLKLELSARGENASIFTYHDFRIRGNEILIPRWDRYLDQYENLIETIKLDLEKTISHLKNWGVSTSNSHDIVVIERSKPPEILDSEEGKEARWFPGYGTERRQLGNGEEIHRFLVEKGFKVNRYYPGDESLKSQISVFSNAKLIIGIRGAELLNMIWMAPKSKVIIQESADFKNEPIQIKLAKALGMELIIIPHGGEVSPSINPKEVISHITHE